MENKEFYIFGAPIEMGLCTVRFLKYIEYVEVLPELSLMSLNVLHIYYQYKSAMDNKDKEVVAALNELKNESLYNIVDSQDSFRQAYEKIFNLVIGEEEVVGMIMKDEQLFLEYRQLVLDMQLLNEEQVSSNEEIQKAIERSRRVKQKKAEKQSFSDIVSSIVAGTSNSFTDVMDMTVLQVYAVYYRMGALLNYKTSTLFATVAEKVQIESWNKHIDLFNSESDTIEKGEFNKKFGSMFS